MMTTLADPFTIRQTQLYIDGKFCPSSAGITFATFNPATEEKLADIPEAEKEDIDLAVAAARRALSQGLWAQMSGAERGRLMFRLADLMEANVEELARLESLDVGKPYLHALKGDIPGAIGCLRYFAGWADKLHGKTLPADGPYHSYSRREPAGVCGLIVPWNYPLSLACWKLGPLLATGCTGVLKPAEQSSLTALRMAELFDEAGLPPGVVNVVTGIGPVAGAALVEHPDVDKIAFTGDCNTALVIRNALSQSMKRLTCELGGKSANIVFADADQKAAVAGAINAIFSNNGQNCCAGSRLFVHESIYDSFVRDFVKATETLKVGDPFDPATSQGSIADKAQFDKVMRYINLGKEQGATLLTGGERVGDRGYFVQPTVFADVSDDMAIATDEIFGPVASVLKFSNFDEVMQRANSSRFGLAAGVWTQDLNTAQAASAALQAGTVWVNCYNICDNATPFGGYKMSGLGRDLGEAALDGYTEHKTVTMKLAAPSGA